MRVCVFLGSNAGRSPVYADTAMQFGTMLAERGIGLVYGGGTVGLMGLIADAPFRQHDRRDPRGAARTRT
jgi:predicted Rossmann-fold nucleotide-binding protein